MGGSEADVSLMGHGPFLWKFQDHSNGYYFAQVSKNF